VRIDIHLPPDLDQGERQRLTEREADRGQALMREGVIQRIWRMPGRASNVGIWRAEDATALHNAIASLPMFAYMQVDVTPLARHYLEEP